MICQLFSRQASSSFCFGHFWDSFGQLTLNVRSIASIGERHFIVVKRKNKHDYRLEEVLSLKLQVWSPFHVVCQYVALTSKLVPPGGLLLSRLHRPWSGVTSNSIASLARSELMKFGVYMFIFGPHTTRGAFCIVLVNSIANLLRVHNKPFCPCLALQNQIVLNEFLLSIGFPSQAQSRQQQEDEVVNEY